MDEKEILDVLANYKKAIEDIIEYQKHLGEEIIEIKTAIMDELINPVKEEFDKYQYDLALSDFREKHAEKLEGFNDKLKALEGEDFDIMEKAFDDFNAREDDMDEDTYVEKLAEKVGEQLNTIGAAFGIEPEKIEEVKVETEDGEVKAEVEDGEVVAVENETETETNTEEVKEEEEVTSDEPEKEGEDEPTADVESETVEEEEEEERPELATDTPDDEEENYKYWSEIAKEVK